MTQPKKPASNPKALSLARTPGQTEAQALSRAALRPSINCASVIEAYQGNLMGKDVDLSELAAGLNDTFKRVEDGDLSTLEAMLVAQATALQTIFASLARRAATQEHLRQYEKFHGAGAQGAGAKPGDHHGAGGLEVPTAGNVREAGQHSPRAATGEQWRGGWG